MQDVGFFGWEIEVSGNRGSDGQLGISKVMVEEEWSEENIAMEMTA